MSSDFDREALVSIFTTEAADGLAQLQAALARPEPDRLDAAMLHDQFIVAHRVKGAAALYGFNRVADLAGVLEQIFEHPPDLSGSDWPATVVMAREVIAALGAQIGHIRSNGTEDAASLEELCRRYPRLASLQQEAPSPAVEKIPSEPYLIPNLDPEVFSYFSPEAQEYLEAITSSLLQMEKDPDDQQTLDQLFRATHTLKGSAYTVGFQAIGDLVHHMEDIVDALRDGQIRLTAQLTDLIFDALDVVRALLKRDPDALEQTREAFLVSRNRLHQTATEAGAQEARPAIAESPPTPAEPAAVEPAMARPMPTPFVRSAERRQRRVAPDKAEGVVIRVRRDRLEHLLNLVGELVIGRTRIEQRLTVLEQLSRQVLANEGRLLKSVRTFEEKHTFTTPSAETSQPGWLSSAQPADFGDLELDKYDDFNILARSMTEGSSDVSEAMAQLSTALRQGREEIGQLQELTLGLRDEITRTRMVPFSSLFTRFQKTVREMGRASGKSVTLAPAGGEIELDTDVVQRLVDPLIHLLRNAVYHGIETAEDREACGKPPMGTISLRAGHQGNAVVIELEDDGAGLDVGKIKARAVTMGVLSPEEAAVLTDGEAANLIYRAGFSTAGVVGEQAGRGMGMDVVRRVVQGVNGHIEVETRPGAGTKFILRFPLTLLISGALIVRLGDQRYAIPLPSIRQVLRPLAGDIEKANGRSILRVGDETIPIRALDELLGAGATASPQPGAVVVLRTMRGILGVVVDALLGRQEIVIKSLGTFKLFKSSCYCGAAIDPEGRVILVLDAENLLARHHDTPAGPARMPAQPAVASGAQARPGGAGPSTGREAAKILLIDDSLSVRKFITRMLEAAGYAVDTAVDGEEGLRKARVESYRLILTDLEMPKINGYELIQSLRELPRTKSTPIIVMTTRVGEKHRQVAMNLGATSYISKPVDERALIREVTRGMWDMTGARF